jgi:DNA-binding XRE family transcriptional regulator
MNTADLVRLIRGRSGLSQTDFGAKIDASRPTIAQWESGKHKPRYDSVVKIIEVFKPTPSISTNLLSLTKTGDRSEDLNDRVRIALNQLEEKLSHSPKLKSVDEQIKNLVEGLFDLVISGEITFRKGADPNYAAKYLLKKLSDMESDIDTQKLKMVADKTVSYNK